MSNRTEYALLIFSKLTTPSFEIFDCRVSWWKHVAKTESLTLQLLSTIFCRVFIAILNPENAKNDAKSLTFQRLSTIFCRVFIAILNPENAENELCN